VEILKIKFANLQYYLLVRISTTEGLK